jgi:type I restriction enzyme S subunit
MSPLYTIFNFNNSENDFYAHYFKSTHWHQYMRQSSSTGARHDRMSITHDAFMGLPLPISSPEEQRKIADFLTTVDDLIFALTQKLAAIKAHKRGVMQQIFPAKGETMPNFRFPEFKGKAAWKTRKLADLLHEHGNKSTGIEEVFSVSVHKGLVNQVEHLGRSFSASSTDHYNRVLPGDMVYTKSPTGDFPLGVIKQSKLNFDVIVSPLYGVFSPETNALGALLDAYFESPENAFIYLEPLAQKGAKNTININNNKFLSGSLTLPVEEAEQRKIADFLTTVDDLIFALTQKLDAIKAHKRGVMQQIFPKDE